MFKWLIVFMKTLSHSLKKIQRRRCINDLKYKLSLIY